MKLAFGIRYALAIAVAGTLAAPAAAQTWPARPVRIIAPFSPGGGTDIVGRFLAQKLTEQTGGSFVVENRPGAGATISRACCSSRRLASAGCTCRSRARENR